MTKLFIWGTGCSAGELLRKSIDIKEVCAFVDSNPVSSTFMHRPVITPQQLANSEYDLVIVASRSCRAIRQSCIELGISLEKVLFLKNNFEVADINRSYTAAMQLLGKEKIDELLPKPLLVTNPGNSTSRLTDRDFEDDYVRIKTLELVVARLEGVSGCAAELGVYKGSFARCINMLMPERRLYLFDTFDGFDMGELKSEGCADSFAQAHMNTDAERVFSIMPHKESVQIMQGLFPESLKGLDERFAFVSLDVDLERSTYAGLEYFAPRMNRGGYIFLHDYNSHLSGVRKALERYERDKQLHIPAIPMSDSCGTLALCF